MAVNSIKIFDDTVIKLSVNQGLEDQRATETLGSFTMGELAYTRDTGRLFVGDNSDNAEEHKDLQQTVGGILTGNKYLGMVDSRPLATFSDNTTPLSYENTTRKTPTQESNDYENALLLKDSKFRLRGDSWSNWDRAATYNKKYNAYNGDYMYDIYNNAFIFFDNRITDDVDSEFQPKIKLDENGLPVTPETFIVNGEEISSDDPRALDIKRRTVLKNYYKENDNYINPNPIYGDGYVIARIIEPDNETIRFRQRSFSQNGLPGAGGNYSHNIIEIANIKSDNLKQALSDDFTISDLVYLNKNISEVQSITAVNGNLLIPASLTFSYPLDNGTRGANGFLRWNVVPVLDELDPEENYEISLKFNSMGTNPNDGSDYPIFDLQVGTKKPDIPTYQLILGTGLNSSQSDPSMLILDESAVTGDDAPTLTVDLSAVEGKGISGVTIDPFNVIGQYENIAYSGNLQLSTAGTILAVDSYSEAYYAIAKDKIDRYEEQNPPINYLVKPITIVSTSPDATLNSGLHVYLDFAISPYVYCLKKVVSSSNDDILPAITDMQNLPDSPDTTYFDTFTLENNNYWNTAVYVIGHNHYKNLLSQQSEVIITDDSLESNIIKPCFKGISGLTVDDDLNIEQHNDLDSESEIHDAVFAWKKVAGVYYIDSAYDARSNAEKSTGSAIIDYIYVEGNNTNLINGGPGVVAIYSKKINDIGELTDEDDENNVSYYIFAESPLFDRFQSYIQYGNSDTSTGFQAKYDLRDKQGLEFAYKVNIKSAAEGGDPLLRVIFKSGSSNTPFNINVLPDIITVDTILPNSNLTPANYQYMILEYQGHETVYEEDEETGGLTESEREYTYYQVYQILQNVKYLFGAYEPGKIEDAIVFDGEQLVTGTVDETIDEQNRIYIPEHARSIILEVTHISQNNNQIGIFSANSFDDLGLILPGISRVDNTHTMLADSGYKLSNNVYKLTPPQLITQFHNKNATLEANAAVTPTALCPALKEKVMFISSGSEVKTIEVPLFKSKTSGIRHFALRVSNLNGEHVIIRVLGYRA